ncbi:protein phosphatase regulator [Friedmanniomyces endolithicus]|uniref:Protein phosphatase regulator n=1 Tax=Friedmanniomyces endolithicus TaxID=329885 RepID=A0AAN6K4E4_9PEZI|nr:protein phosphatase regulator [Friedmanniomyces endolithicus]KAK0925505.1 protein phosphatase regulator [Friedmanniomyces endolithicus]KAK0957359.1 protein phosphatase regulator [Friedmanniomyces endolithicus]KAK1006144.1 protein phosphatase regulator [Friedmanniomyces endolithicus]KAK1048897.1 protein phosphatase regulator [Friedmanniomyces endolithicus]
MQYHLSEHHHTGRYGRFRETGLDEVSNTDDIGDQSSRIGTYVEDDGRSESSVHVRTDLRPIESPFRAHFFTRSLSAVRNTPPSISSIDSLDLAAVLLPLDDPLLDSPPSPIGSSNDSWESTTTDSDLSSYREDHRGNNDDAEDAFLSLDPRFVDVGWGGECLRETEDIDFEFVYALHTFVATVEGQANATKGDTMVLLDDSNSYWWLVRVVKDASIGYLPAEHIETPTERLARLNKHRNIDLSATMLSDNSEKSRNPLNKVLRRRNAKTVQFAAPTYVEASDYDYSSDEDEQAMIDPYQTAAVATAPVAEPQHKIHSEEAAAVETRAEDGEERAGTPNRGSFDREQAATHTPSIDEPQLSPKLVDKTEAAPLKSKKGRNRDSFLKDETETRKITLTPGLLREDSVSLKSVSSESTRNGSTENLVKTTSPPDQAAKKDTKEKKKDKPKGGMLSGLFKSKKKEKKPRDEAGPESDVEKSSLEMKRAESPRGRPANGNGSSAPLEKGSAGVAGIVPDVQTKAPPSRGKLQKQPPSQTSSPVRETAKPGGAFVAELQGSEVAHEMASGQEAKFTDASRRPEEQMGQQQQQREGAGALSTIKDMLSPSTSAEGKPQKAKRIKQRMELDDFDSADEEGHSPNPFVEQEELRQRDGGAAKERLSESPVEITPGTFMNMHGTEIVHIPTPGGEDDEEEDPMESLTSSPAIVEHPVEHERGQRDTQEAEEEEDDEATPTALVSRSPQPPTTIGTTETAPHKSTGLPSRELSGDHSSTTTTDSSRLLPPTSHYPSTTTPNINQLAWSDSSLRAWLDDGTELRDMLTLIHAKPEGVEAVGPEHPMMAGLYVEQRRGVEKMMGELDGLLSGYLERKGIALG